MACNVSGTGDTGCYEQTLTIDPNKHQQGGLVDALGRKAYVQRFTGSTSYALYATTKYTYDVNGNLTQILQPDGVSTTTFQYDHAGRKTQQADPDNGLTIYSFDQDSNLTQSVDARGAAGTVFAGYDGIDRPLWRNSTNSATGAFATFAYDSTASGNQGAGRLTGETFSGGPSYSLTGSYAHVYDARGQETSRTLTVGSQAYPVLTSFDDAGKIVAQTYPTNEVVTSTYPQGWLTGVSTRQGSTTTTLLSNPTYSQGSNQFGGPAGQITGASLGGGTYQYSASFDALLRATDLKVTNASGSTTFFDQARTFDGAGNVTQANTTLPAGSDNQAFCYDEQNRLTWSGGAGTPPCGVNLTPGTISAAQYTNSFAYDNLGRLASGPLGSYIYGNAAHVHAATAIGTAWTAAYDAAGNMSCRAPLASATCSGTPTGALLTFDSQGQLAAWQNTPSNPTSTDGFLYNNQGNRVEQQVTSNGTTTTTIYVGNLEQVATSGSSTTATTSYYANGQRIALAVNGVFSYLASDGLGSAVVALNASGGVTASQLYAPYGGVRYSSGTMPTDYGFTGQHADSTIGLDYYNARYYDPVAGQFASADTILPGNGYDIYGLSRYAYVEGNPVTRTDPSGNLAEAGGGAGCDFDCSIPTGDGALGGLISGIGNTATNTLSGAGTVAGNGLTAIGNAANGLAYAILNPFFVPTYSSGDEADLNQLANRAKDQGMGSALPVLDAVATVAMIVQMVDGGGELLTTVRATEAAGAAGTAGRESITLYHGSIDNFTEISQNGLNTARLPAYVTDDPAAAANAIGRGRVLRPDQGLDRGIVSSTVSRSALQSLIDSGGVDVRGWPGFGGGGPFSEFQLWSNEAIDLFNSGIGR